MDSWAVVVLAAGKGTRMVSSTPKVLHRICGKAMVQFPVDLASDAGLRQKVIVVPQESQLIRETLGASVEYAEKTEPLGSGHALLQAEPSLRNVENLLVHHADVPLTRVKTIEEMVRHHQASGASITLLTADLPEPNSLGRVVRSNSGSIVAVVEQGEADDETLTVNEINGGIYCFGTSWLWENLKTLSPSHRGEVFLTDLIALAAGQGQRVESVKSADNTEILGVNTRIELARAEAVMLDRIRERWMLSGVTMPDAGSVYLSAAAQIGQDSVLLPNTHITGDSRIGRNCQIGPNSIVSDSQVGDGCRVTASVVEESILEESVSVGPFSHIRAGSRLERDVHIGNFAEVKNSRIGRGTKSGHFSYVGDAELGRRVNIGAGTVTCNYDGSQKNQTRIGDDAFIGSDTMLVAPINIGARSSTGAGSVVTKDVPSDSTAVGAPARVTHKKERRTAKE